MGTIINDTKQAINIKIKLRDGTIIADYKLESGEPSALDIFEGHIYLS